MVGDLQETHVEEPDVGYRLAGQLFDQFPCVRALDLIPVELSSALIDGGSLVALDLRVVLPGLEVVVDPIAGGWTSDQAKPAIGVVEEDGVADDIAARVRG